MKKICNVIIIILITIAVILSVKIFNKYIKNRQNEKNKQNVIEKIQEQLETSKGNETEELPYIEYEGYQVIGTIKIEKIGLEYPILNITTEESMKKSITKYWGDKINQAGNVTLAGHNNFDGTMFGNIKKLEIGDEIIILDLYNNSVTYKVFDKYVTNPNDVNVLQNQEDSVKEITLVTCTNGNKKRFVIKAKEV